MLLVQRDIDMGTASKYWKLVRLDASGGCRTEEVRSAKDFFFEQFPQLGQSQTEFPELSDIQIQHHLLELAPVGNSVMAQWCLRCFISHQIHRVCQKLAEQFGRERGFTERDLLPLVLDDVPPSFKSNSSYRSLAARILQTFQPERAGLSTWTARLVKRHPELTRFLLDRGIYLISDWAILNDTKLTQLRRIFADFYNLSKIEVQNHSNLLDCYHKVYRLQRIEQRQSGLCLPPTRVQLEEICHQLDRACGQRKSPEEVMERLQKMAQGLRQYRIYVRVGKPKTDSLDRSDINWQVRAIPTQEVDDGKNPERNAFLSAYRTDFEGCLDRAVEQVVQARLARKPRKNAPTPEQFVTALHMFHCEGKSMSEIANSVGLEAQYKVSRMLKLKNFRADVRQQMLVKLLKQVLDRASIYTDADRLSAAESQVEGVLSEQIDTQIEEAAKEASLPHARPTKSLFARRLCHYLKQINACESQRCEC